MAPRILSGIILLISVLFLPFWISVILGLLAIFYFPSFYEAVVIFILSDLLFGAKEARFLDITFVSSIGAILLLWAVELSKKKLRFYRDYDR